MSNVPPSTRDRILTFVADYWKAQGYAPTVREIGKAVGLSSPSTVHAHLAELRAQGRLAADPNRPRTIRVVVP